MKRKSADSLAPGFRFHPTDEELVRYYLKRKVAQKPLRFDPISEIDIYKAEPWDLPDKSRLKTRDLEWYFFSALDKKYGNGSKTNRSTEKGYWKTTGKDRAVRHGSRIFGMKKTLVYHFGRAPRGDRTNWVMHEYRLTDEELEKAGISQDAFVLCRIFQKSGSGPKNGEQYGAPFVEEEWEEDDEVSLLPEQEVFTGQVLQTDGMKFDANEFEQNLNFGISTGDVLQPNSFYYGDTSNSSELDEALVEDNCKSQISIGESIQLQDNLIGLPEQYQVNVAPVKQEEDSQSPNDLNGLKLDDLLDGIFLDASDNPAFGDTPFLQTDNPSVSAATSAADFDLDEFFNFYDAEENIFMNTDSSQMMTMGVNNNYFDESLFASNISNQTTQADPSETSQLFALPQEYRGSSLLKKQTESDGLTSDNDYQLSAKSSNFWDNLPAPPAYASEFPSKDALLKLNSVNPSSRASSSSAHTTATTVRIRNMTLSGKEMDLSFGKNGEVNLVLSFQLAEDGPVRGATTSAKTTSSTSWRWLSCLFLSAVLIPVSFKFGSLIWSS